MKQVARKGTVRIVVSGLAVLLLAVLSGCQRQLDTARPLSVPSVQPSAEIVQPATEEPRPPTPDVLRTIEYQVQEILTLANEGPGEPSKQNVWVALIRDVGSYQSVRSMQVSPPDYDLVTDEYGNLYAEFNLSDMPAGTTVEIRIDYRVAVHELTYDLSVCTGFLPEEWTQAELHVESNNPQIVDLSKRLAAGRDTVCDQVRALYDYVGNRLVYSYNGQDWGAQAALGEMGADCTEYTSLMMALSRASRIPAQYLEGLWAGGENSQNDARTEHAWLQVYLPGAGWVPMDPTLGRSSLSREEYFAHLPPDHIVVTVGRNPSTLRGASYWTHVYWPGTSTVIRVKSFDWTIEPAGD